MIEIDLPLAVFRHLRAPTSRLLVLPENKFTRSIGPDTILSINRSMIRVVGLSVRYQTLAQAFESEKAEFVYEGCPDATTAKNFFRTHMRLSLSRRVRVLHLLLPHVRKIAMGERGSYGMCMVEIGDAIYEIPHELVA